MMELTALVREALSEDIGQGDVTTNATVPASSRCQAWLIAKQDGVLSGINVFRTVFQCLDVEMADWSGLTDGSRFKKSEKIAGFQGRTRAVLTGERVALNFLQHLCGIATLASRFKETVNGMTVRVCDTRKTTPLMRHLEKQAVVHGGCVNHRYALFDGVLIKENHVTAAKGIRHAIAKAVEGTHHLMKIGIEVRNLEELDEAINAGADAIILDNMSLDEMRQAVRRVEGTRVLLEASGNITLERARAVAETGVHLLSVGALTHSAPAIDLSLIIANV